MKIPLKKGYNIFVLFNFPLQLSDFSEVSVVALLQSMSVLRTFAFRTTAFSLKHVVKINQQEREFDLKST